MDIDKIIQVIEDISAEKGKPPKKIQLKKDVYDKLIEMGTDLSIFKIQYKFDIPIETVNGLLTNFQFIWQ